MGSIYINQVFSFSDYFSLSFFVTNKPKDFMCLPFFAREIFSTGTADISDSDALFFGFTFC